MPSKNTNIGAKRAKELRHELGLDPAEALGCIVQDVAEELGVHVGVAQLPEGIAGACWHDDGQSVLWVNAADAPVRRRFTLAHELGHVRCGHDAQLNVDSFATMSGKTTDGREVQANAFAAELLAPSDGVRARVGKSATLDDVVLLAAHYGVSTIAALYRLSTLEIAGEYEALKEAIEDGRHFEAYQRLDPPALDDLFARLTPAELPYLSPAIRDSALAAMRAGETTVDRAAHAADCDPGRLARAAAGIGI